MNILVLSQDNPNKTELHNFFESVFLEIEDTENFAEEQNQKLVDWFSMDELMKYLVYGKLFEVRSEEGVLIGALFMGQQNPISWPDGNKMEIFIMGVDKKFQGMGIARQLMHEAENFALKECSKKIIVNTHSAMESVHSIYRKFNYIDMGILKDYYDNGDAYFFQKTLATV